MTKTKKLLKRFRVIWRLDFEEQYREEILFGNWICWKVGDRVGQGTIGKQVVRVDEETIEVDE